MIITKTKYFDIVEWAMNVLHIDATVSVVENTPLLERLAGDGYELYAAVFPSSIAHNYQLIVSENATELAIIHECIHLQQFERGDLVRNTDGSYSWKGESWDKKAKYYSRPWEKEAFKLEKQLYAKWKKFKKQ